MLGVSHFTFHNYTIGPRASCVLNHYKNGNFKSESHDPIVNQRPTITTLPWNFDLMDIRDNKEVWSLVQLAAHNDCLYRSMYRYKYAMFMDLDEFIIPHWHAHHTLNELIE